MIIKTPTILQMDNAECGAVALAIILAYFGRHVSASDVREACDVSRDGSKAINIIKAARKYGLEAHGMQLNMDNIKLLPPPFIVFWQFNHFLVVDGFTDTEIFLNDPATGPRTINYQEFDAGFTGIALFLRPGEEFQTGGQPPPSFFQLLWRGIKDSHFNFFYMLALSLGLMIPSLSIAFFAKIFINNILLAEQYHWMIPLAILMLASAVMMGLVTRWKRTYLNKFYQQLKLQGAIQFFWRLLHLPIAFFQQRATGDISERIESYHRLANLLAEHLADSLTRVVAMIFYILVMLLLSWPLAVIGILLGIINFSLLWMLSHRMSGAAQQQQQIAGKLAGIEMNGIQIIETIKASAVENQFFNQWAAFHAQKINSSQVLEKYAALSRILPVLLQMTGNLLILGVGTRMIMSGHLTAGTLAALLILINFLNQPLMNLLFFSEQLFKIKADVARMNDVNQHQMDHVLKNTAEPTPLLIDIDQPLLTLDTVQFGYSRLEPPIFDDLSLSLMMGKHLAIVGPTGGGKSSLSKLVSGLYAPWSGQVLIHGKPLTEISRKTLSETVGLVDQNIFLFAATIRDNLTLWNADIPDEQIYHALEIAMMADIIKKRGGLDSWVEERGRNFSGGQVQRLEIARALIGRPSLLILDEATSALDPLIEQQIYLNLQRQHCTLMIIAHRLSAIRDCDQIIVIDGGKVVQSGRHDELIKVSGLYQDLVSLEIQ